MRISDWSSDVCSSDLQSDIIFFILHAFFAEQPLGTHAIGAHHLGINFHTGHNGCSLLFAEIGIGAPNVNRPGPVGPVPSTARSEEHTSELQSLMRISYAVFCLKKKNKTQQHKK